MPAKPWKALIEPASERECVALLSYLPLKSYWFLLHVAVYTGQVSKQLGSANGCVGYSMLGRPLAKRFWTLSAWESNEALEAFVEGPPHVRIMTALAPHLDKTAFLRWTIRGSGLPLRWPDALTRFAAR